MSEKKNMTGKENSFHMENFRRRSRYAAVFLVLDRHVQWVGGMFVFMLAARMLGHALALMPDLDHRLTCF